MLSLYLSRAVYENRVNEHVVIVVGDNSYCTVLLFYSSGCVSSVFFGWLLLVHFSLEVPSKFWL